MADSAGQAEIRGINIDKAAKGYQEEQSIFYSEVTVRATPSREIRWYQETSGILTATSPCSIKVAEGAVPWVLETTWTRNTSYTQKYMLDSPMIKVEDESDSDVPVFMRNMEKIVEAIVYDRDADIWNVATENQTPVNINSVTSTAAWDAGSGQNPYEDVAEAIQKIREQTKKKLEDPVLYVSAKGEKDLKVWIVGQGALWNQFAASMGQEGRLTLFAGCRVVVSENVTADYALVGSMKKAVEYREFKAMTTAIITEELVGRKVRAMTNGIALLVLPKFLALIGNTES